MRAPTVEIQVGLERESLGTLATLQHNLGFVIESRVTLVKLLRLERERATYTGEARLAVLVNVSKVSPEIGIVGEDLTANIAFVSTFTRVRYNAGVYRIDILRIVVQSFVFDARTVGISLLRILYPVILHMYFQSTGTTEHATANYARVDLHFEMKVPVFAQFCSA